MRLFRRHRKLFFCVVFVFAFQQHSSPVANYYYYHHHYYYYYYYCIANIGQLAGWSTNSAERERENRRAHAHWSLGRPAAEGRRLESGRFAWRTANGERRADVGAAASLGKMIFCCARETSGQTGGCRCCCCCGCQGNNYGLPGHSLAIRARRPASMGCQAGWLDESSLALTRSGAERLARADNQLI